MKKFIVIIISIIAFLSIAVVGGYFWNRGLFSRASVSPQLVLAPSLGDQKKIDEEVPLYLAKEQVASYLAEEWITYDQRSSPIQFSYPKSWEDINIEMWWPDAHTKGTRYEYFFHHEGGGNLRAHDERWPQTLPVALRVESSDSVFRGSNDELMISATKVDLSKADSEIKKDIALPGTKALSIERVTISQKQGLYVEETGRTSRGKPYHRLYYLFPKFDETSNFHLTVAMTPELKDVLDRFIQRVVFGSTDIFSKLDPYIFEHQAVSTKNWQTITNAKFGVSFKVPQDWVVRGCGEGFEKYLAKYCDGKRVYIHLMPKSQLLPESGGDMFEVSFSEERDVNKIAMGMMSTYDQKKEAEQSVFPVMSHGVYRFQVAKQWALLHVFRDVASEVKGYDLIMDKNDFSLNIHGLDGLPRSGIPNGTFRAFLDSFKL